jgi:hypothetical protein
MQISSSGVSSIQMLKAQQAWEARRARAVAQPEPQPEELVRPTRQKTGPLADEPLAVSSPSGDPWSRTVQEVQSIAQRAGYIGVTEQDIRRAYTLGESLLADYRV